MITRRKFFAALAGAVGAIVALPKLVEAAKGPGVYFTRQGDPNDYDYTLKPIIRNMPVLKKEIVTDRSGQKWEIEFIENNSKLGFYFDHDGEWIYLAPGAGWCDSKRI